MKGLTFPSCQIAEKLSSAPITVVLGMDDMAHEWSAALGEKDASSAHNGVPAPFKFSIESGVALGDAAVSE